MTRCNFLDLRNENSKCIYDVDGYCEEVDSGNGDAWCRRQVEKSLLTPSQKAEVMAGKIKELEQDIFQLLKVFEEKNDIEFCSIDLEMIEGYGDKERLDNVDIDFIY